MEPTRSAGAGGPGPAGLPGWPERLPARAGRNGRPPRPAKMAGLSGCPADRPYRRPPGGSLCHHRPSPDCPSLDGL